jgi:addiction module HigA family antidote
MSRKSKLGRLPPIHPGEFLHEDFLLPLGMSVNALAQKIGVPRARLNDIVNEKRGISADTALRLGRYFGMSPEIWLGFQVQYDLEIANRAIGPALKGIKPRRVKKSTETLESKAA